MEQGQPLPRVPAGLPPSQQRDCTQQLSFCMLTFPHLQDQGVCCGGMGSCGRSVVAGGRKVAHAPPPCQPYTHLGFSEATWKQNSGLGVSGAADLNVKRPGKELSNGMALSLRLTHPESSLPFPGGPLLQAFGRGVFKNLSSFFLSLCCLPHPPLPTKHTYTHIAISSNTKTRSTKVLRGQRGCLPSFAVP